VINIFWYIFVTKISLHFEMRRCRVSVGEIRSWEDGGRGRRDKTGTRRVGLGSVWGWESVWGGVGLIDMTGRIQAAVIFRILTLHRRYPDQLARVSSPVQ
jgi:hypothetical protein